ncbi:phosphodiester glycosidase family protein [Streptomyces sp. NBC_00250]|uniref:phosphodiester glycosidase family protein n=1 Tax=Streptomyces sp. NBC_00250 TaxID=2903641 RepID=UPI002E2E3BFD|nr:phosphodiester glycosidase family protein [Streptomyces sp. NBC_00250]
MTRNRLRPWVAVAAALGAALTLTSPAANAEEPVTAPLAKWTEGAPVKIAAGVTRTTWTENVDLVNGTSPDNRAKPRILQIVEIDPTAGALTLESTIGTNGGSAEKVIDQLAQVSAATRHPYAGVNGGLFQPEPAGAGAADTAAHSSVSATDGVLHSSSCWMGGKGSTGAVIQYGTPYITKLLTDLKLIGPSGETVRIDDFNRTPGRPPHCARDAEDTLVSTKPSVYTDPDEIVVFTDDYGLPVPKPGTDPSIVATTDAGFEVVVDAHGVVTKVGEGRGGTVVPAGGRIIQGIGTGAQWLRDRLAVDDRVTIDQKLHDVTQDRDIPLDDSVDVVSSFHQLLRNGTIPTELPNSCSEPRTGKNGTTQICIDSRTALGTNVYGRPVLVTLSGQTTADGVYPEANEDGDYLRNFATLLSDPDLGIIDAINLDGGGSTTLVTRSPTGTAVNTPPTDRVGGQFVHRKVADSVYTGVGGYGMYAKP